MSQATAERPPAKSLASSKHADINAVAGELVLEFGPIILKDAIQYSRNLADAEDAYQRSVEIMLKKAPTTSREELLPWLRTVVRREALAIANARSRERVGIEPDELEFSDATELSPEDAAESIAELEIGAEALQRLTLDQARCLVAQSKGMTYDQIADTTGFTRRKVTRCLENGRNAFAAQLDEIASGSQCARMEPLMHKVLRGDADAAIELRPHLRHCRACRARFSAYELAPRRIAALFPPSVFIAGGRPGRLFGRGVEWLQATADRIAVQFLGADRWVDVALAKKTIAVAAIATATATGGVAVHGAIDQWPTGEHGRDDGHSPAALPATRSIGHGAQFFTPVDAPPLVRHRAVRKQKVKARRVRPAPAQSHGAPSVSPAPPRQPIDDGSSEFLPEARK